MDLNQSINIFLLIIIRSYFTYSSECFMKNNNFVCRLGFYTPYRVIANHDTSPLHYPGCTEKQIWLAVRHGIRNPGEDYMIRIENEVPMIQKIILENYKLNQTSLTSQDAALFEQWNLNISKNDALKLADEGRYETIGIAKRYQSRFPSLLQKVYDKKKYKFRYTVSHRTEETAKYFTTELFGWHLSQNISYLSSNSTEPILQFYKRCPRWTRDVDYGANTRLELQRFLNTTVFKNMVENITRRIGYKFNIDTIFLMQKLCVFDTIIYKLDLKSPWCRLFTLLDHDILEYAVDLEHYWLHGYGYRLSYEQACPTVKDMFDFFTNEKDKLASINFTHSSMMIKFLTLLGIGKDSIQMRHDSYPIMRHRRTWRTSINCGFATNVAFVLYDCSGVPSVLVMHQERPLYLPGCPVNMPCPMSIMRDLYPDNDDECQLDAMCST